VTPIFATQPALAITDLHHIQDAATQMEVVAIADNAPWLYSALFNCGIWKIPVKTTLGSVIFG